VSIRPVVFHADGSVEVVFDELGHSGTIAAAAIAWAPNVDGTPDHKFVVLDCPDGCGARSTHPVGGGAAAVDVQQLFVHKTESSGCGCGNVEAGNATLADAHVHLNVARMDGEARYQL
jgi:hypothetical protein